MENLIVRRLVKIWIEDIYHVDKITQEVVNSAIDGEIDEDETDIIWDCMEDLGSYEVFNNKGNLIYSKYSDNE